jgi:uncharacterized protein with PIN domain
MKRKLVTSGRIEAVLLASDRPAEQIHQVVTVLHLKDIFSPFTRCMEDNRLLEERIPGEVETNVPPYVFKTQTRFMECPHCHRIYWRGTHWQEMEKRLEKLAEC